jgi:1-acyl-sn-glycerol-3-phosphate acyltransferase
MIPRLRALLLLGFWFGLIGLLGPILILIALVTKNEKVIYKPVRFFIKLGLQLAGVRVRVEGLERLDPNQTYLFTPNHQSMIEVPLLLAYLGRNFGYLAKKELFKYPIFGYGMQLVGVIPVDRSNTVLAVESARLAAEKMREGKDYIVYPEGTRSPDGRLLPFKKGAFIMAIDAGVPIVPVSISGSAAVMPKGQIKMFPATVHITLHDPISTEGYSKENLTELIQITRERILSGLKENHHLEQIQTHKCATSGEKQ